MCVVCVRERQRRKEGRKEGNERTPSSYGTVRKNQRKKEEARNTVSVRQRKKRSVIGSGKKKGFQENYNLRN